MLDVIKSNRSVEGTVGSNTPFIFSLIQNIITMLFEKDAAQHQEIEEIINNKKKCSVDQLFTIS